MNGNGRTKRNDVQKINDIQREVASIGRTNGLSVQHARLPWQAWCAPASEDETEGLVWMVSTSWETHTAIDICQIVLDERRAEANAEFIVTAVNSHDELLRAARCGAQWLRELSTMIE